MNPNSLSKKNGSDREKNYVELKTIDSLLDTHNSGEGKRRNEFAEWHVVWLAE